MDIPTISTQPMPQSGRHIPREAVILTVAGIACILIAAAILVFSHSRNITSKLDSFAVSVGPAPASPLYTIDHSKGILKPLTVIVKGTALPALDAVKTTDGSWYYILAERSPTPVGNLYVQKPGGTITALTTSKTAKYNLSYDPQSGRLAYQALMYTTDKDFFTNQQWNLVVYDPSTQREVIVGTGMDPHIITGGQALVYREGGKLNVEVLGSHATSTIANLPMGSIMYAVNPKTTALSMYNSVSHAIDTFAITQSTSLNYVSSSNVSVTPVSIGYVGDVLVAAYASKTASSTSYVFSRPDLSGLNAITVSGIAGQIPQRLYTYE